MKGFCLGILAAIVLSVCIDCYHRTAPVVDPLTIHFGEDADSCFELIGDPDALVWRDGRFFASWNGGMELVFDDQRRLIGAQHPASYVKVER